MPPYADDIARYSSGYIGLFEQGRFLSEFLIKAINGFSGTYAIEAYTPVLVTSFLMSYFTLKYVSEKINIDMYILLPVFITPYMLENMSYHVDIICMYISFCLSIMASFASLCLRRHIIAFAYLTSASFFYQASFSVYASFAILMLIVKMIDGRYTFLSALKCLSPVVIIFIASFIVVIVVTRLVATSGYIDSHSSLIGFNGDWMKVINTNIYNINNIAFKTFSWFQKALILMIAALYIASSILYFLSSRSSKLSSLTVVLLPMFSLLFVYLPTVLFSNPVVMPRVMMAYGVILSCFLILPFSYNIIGKVAVSTLSITLMLTFIICSSSYVASTNYIYNKNISIARKIESDIINDKYIDKPEYYYGELKPSPTGINMLAEKSYPIIKIMTRFPLNNPWLTPHIFNLYNIGLNYKSPDVSGDYKERVLVNENDNYKLYRTKTRYVAVFK